LYRKYYDHVFPDDYADILKERKREKEMQSLEETTTLHSAPSISRFKKRSTSYLGSAAVLRVQFRLERPSAVIKTT